MLLDEPYTGLDAVGAAALTAMLQELRVANATLIVATHNVDEGLAVASRAAIMLDGAFVRIDDCSSIDAAVYRATYRALVVGAVEAPAARRETVPA